MSGHVDSILNQYDTQLEYDGWDGDHTIVCPVCQNIARFWYVTACNGDGDYLASLTSHKCVSCGFERFYDQKT